MVIGEYREKDKKKKVGKGGKGGGLLKRKEVTLRILVWVVLLAKLSVSRL